MTKKAATKLAQRTLQKGYMKTAGKLACKCHQCFERIEILIDPLSEKTEYMQLRDEVVFHLTEECGKPTLGD